MNSVGGEIERSGGRNFGKSRRASRMVAGSYKSAKGRERVARTVFEFQRVQTILERHDIQGKIVARVYGPHFRVGYYGSDPKERCWWIVNFGSYAPDEFHEWNRQNLQTDIIDSKDGRQYRSKEIAMQLADKALTAAKWMLL